jgi:hypothetical protein
VVLSDIDPLQSALSFTSEDTASSATPRADSAPRADALDRLYRPQALDVPVLVARDAPIATIDPRSVGNFAGSSLPELPPRSDFASLDIASDVDNAVTQALGGISVPQVLEGPADAVKMIAANDSWVRVSAADGTVIFEKTMLRGDVYDVPITEEPPVLRTGNSGALYFAIAGDCYGPVGDSGAITSNLPLDHQALAVLYEQVDPTADQSLNRMFAGLSNTQFSNPPCKTN